MEKIIKNINLKVDSNTARNHLLDFLKGLACIGVILIHVTFPGKFGAVLSKLSTFAVPLFFMVSGYFAFDEKGCARVKIKVRTVKIIKILFYALLLYVPYRIFRMYELNQLELWLENTFSVEILVKVFVFNDFNFIGAGHLWFLPALIYTYILILFVDYTDLYEVLYKLLPVLFLVKILDGIGVSSVFGATFIISALPFFILGNYIAKKQNIVHKFSNSILLFLTILSGFFICLCFALELKYNPSQLGVILYSSALFLLAVKNPNNSINEKIELLGRKYSLYVYVIHIFINSRLNVWVECLRLSEYILLKWLLPIIVIVLSIVVSVLIDYLGNGK